MQNFNAIDLFSGCGGLSLGFMHAGYNVLAGFDSDTAALKTFEANHSGSRGIDFDLSSDLECLKDLLGLDVLDLIIAGPPCQGFSLTGPRDFTDERNRLYMAVFEAVKIFNPLGFVIENVPGLATLYGGAVRQEIHTRFEALGYNIKSEVLVAADYGVPQIRKRIFFIGIRKDIGTPQIPNPTHQNQNYVSCESAIGDLPPRVDTLGEEVDKYHSPPVTKYQVLMRGQQTELFNHVATNHTQKVIDVISQVPEGGNHKDLPPGVGEHRKFNEAWTRYHSQRPSRTIDTGHRNHFHYKYNRVPTIRENARLQSFPDNFRFFGNKTEQNRQVGNAVPPLLGYHLGVAIKKSVWGPDTPLQTGKESADLSELPLFNVRGSS